MSEEGPQQGDPLGPLLFCLTIHPLLMSFKSELRIGFLDDVTLGGPEEVVSEDLTQIEAEAAKLGLELNKSKCEITSTAKCNQNRCCEAFNGFQITNLESPFLLGSPILPSSPVALEQRTKDLKTAISRLSTLQAHDALVVLRISLIISKLMYTLRTASCHDSPW